jgi:hypothetical protein
MIEKEFVKQIIDLLRKFQKGEIDAEPMIRRYDDLVADHLPYELLEGSK